MTRLPNSQDTPPAKPSLWALSPLLVFFLLYLVISVAVQDFYAVPVTVAFTAAAIWSVAITKGKSITERVDLFSAGVANRNILMMVWIFVLAGAFAQSARDMGAIDATVRLTLHLLPDNLLLASVFIASCFISLSVGTSVGTIVALAPVAVGLAEATNVNTGMMTAIVVGGAFFGDNLSFISDTTIAATRTQGCAMRDKFGQRQGGPAPAPFAPACYMAAGERPALAAGADVQIEWLKVLPYLLVLAAALAGIHVMAVLTLGLLAAGMVGMGMGYFSCMDWFRSMGDGMTGMGELIIVTLLAGGVLAMIRFNGGIAYIIEKITCHIRGRRGAEFSIAALVSLANLCTANNTIAIITAGPIAKDISDRFNIPPRRSASILDTFSCLVQGVIPYGAQMLMAAGIAQISPLQIMKYLYYPLILGVCSAAAIVLGGRANRKHASGPENPA
ncbi:Na+/H+ antiporter NhaC family protein [Akkermansia sp.]|uniref:Na+/H+ antiporter NhaC family protein n=1 Tax=Akkermansia sp. TaxID=1872421 RepID=UPI003994491F